MPRDYQDSDENWLDVVEGLLNDATGYGRRKYGEARQRIQEEGRRAQIGASLGEDPDETRANISAGERARQSRIGKRYGDEEEQGFGTDVRRWLESMGFGRR